MTRPQSFRPFLKNYIHLIMYTSKTNFIQGVTVPMKAMLAEVLDYNDDLPEEDKEIVTYIMMLNTYFEFILKTQPDRFDTVMHAIHMFRHNLISTQIPQSAFTISGFLFRQDDVNVKNFANMVYTLLETDKVKFNEYLNPENKVS